MDQETSISKKRGPKPAGRTPVLVEIDPDVLVRIAEWASANGIAKRTEAIRQLIRRGLAPDRK